MPQDHSIVKNYFDLPSNTIKSAKFGFMNNFFSGWLNAYARPIGFIVLFRGASLYV